MKRIYTLILLSFVLLVIASTSNVFAQGTCMPQRVINQFRCISASQECIEWVSVRLGSPACSGSDSRGATFAQAACSTACGAGNCQPAYCANYANVGGYVCQQQFFNVSCSGPPACEAQAQTASCTWSGANCNESLQNLTYQCYVTNTPAPGSTSGGCTTGQCYPNAPNNCGEVGKDPGSGTCSGGRCCVDKAAGGGNCPANDGQRGLPDCRFGEGGACNWECIVAGGCGKTGSFCQDGLVQVGGACWCPTCSINIHNRSPVVPLNGFLDVRTDWSSNHVGMSFNSTDSSIANYQYVVIGGLGYIRISGKKVGSTFVTVSGYYSDYSPRTLCSSNMNVTVWDAPTATPVNCPNVTTVTGVENKCDDTRVADNGQLTWTWPAVAGVTGYGVTLTNAASGAVISGHELKIIDATSMGCGAGGTCTYQTIGLMGDISYILSVVPSTGSCVQNNTPTSSVATPLALCPGTMSVVGKKVSGLNITCDDVKNGSDTVPGAITWSFNPAVNPASRVQPAGTLTVSTWNNVKPSSYRPIPGVPADYNIARLCVSTDGGATYSVPSGGVAPLESYQTLMWQLGLKVGSEWSRVMDGNADVHNTLQSWIPVAQGADRFFTKASTALAAPGIVTYGSNGSYDFDGNETQGDTLVSEKQWLTEQPDTMRTFTENWYNYFANSFDIASAEVIAPGTLTLNDFDDAQDLFVVNGNLRLNSSTMNTDGITKVIFVTGNLIIDGNILVPSKSFLGIIVNGNINVSPGVGTTFGASATTPQVEGVYITNGIFDTGNSTTANREKLVIKGTVVANSFILSRSLEALNQHLNYPAETFIYDPKYLFLMPEKMKDLSVTWDEVAP